MADQPGKRRPAARRRSPRRLARARPRRLAARYRRTEYDIAGAARAIRAARLPDSLAERLRTGSDGSRSPYVQAATRRAVSKVRRRDGLRSQGIPGRRPRLRGRASLSPAAAAAGCSPPIRPAASTASSTRSRPPSAPATAPRPQQARRQPSPDASRASVRSINTTLIENLSQGAETVSQLAATRLLDRCAEQRTTSTHDEHDPATTTTTPRRPTSTTTTPPTTTHDDQHDARRTAPTGTATTADGGAGSRRHRRRPGHGGGTGGGGGPAATDNDGHDDDRRALPDRGPARGRRHVDRPPRVRRAARALRGAQAARRAPRRRPDVRLALPARGARRRAPRASEHRPGVRLRLRLGPPPALHRDGARRRPVVRRAAARPRPPRRRAGDRRSSPRRAAGSTTPTATASCTATSSPATCSSPDRDVVKLADFGIARATDQSSITQVGSVLGTAAYLAPEQARGEEAGPAGRPLLARRRHLPADVGPAALRGRLAVRAGAQAAARVADPALDAQPRGTP